MDLITLQDIPKIKRWKEIILGNLQSRFSAGITEAEFCNQYKGADPKIIKQAVFELRTEGQVKITPEV